MLGLQSVKFTRLASLVLLAGPAFAAKPVKSPKPHASATPANAVRAERHAPTTSSLEMNAPGTSTAAPDMLAPPVDGLAGTTTATATAAPAPSGATAALLKKIEQKNEAIKTVHATFEQVRFDKVFNASKTSEGELWFERPALLRVDLAGPSADIMLVSGDTFYSYTKKLKQVNTLKFKSAEERDARLYNFLAAFGFKTEELSHHFELASSEDEGAARTELTQSGGDPAKVALLLIHPQPEFKESTPFAQLKIWIDKSTLLPQKIWYREPGGADFTLTMKKIDFGAALPQNQFDPAAVIPRGTEYLPMDQKAGE